MRLDARWLLSGLPVLLAACASSGGQKGTDTGTDPGPDQEIVAADPGATDPGTEETGADVVDATLDPDPGTDSGSGLETVGEDEALLDPGGTQEGADVVDVTSDENPGEEVVCLPMDHKECADGNVYWFDSCGQREELSETCGCGCSDGACDCCPQWACGDWSLCSCENTQTRTCVDSNGCGTEVGKPAESQPCDHCGNGWCDCGETNGTCPGDCPVCGGTVCPVVSGYRMTCNEKGTCEYFGGPGGTMVYVPGGTFWMGANRDGNQCPTNTLDPTAGDDELPCHPVTVPGFLVDKTEVTLDAYAAWLNAGGAGCQKPSGDSCVAGATGASGDCAPALDDTYCNYQKDGKGSHPVNCVNWCEAKAYCSSVGKRLCSEAEWEMAARGTTGDLYPWGDEMATCQYAVMHEGGPEVGCGTGSTMAVGSKSPSGDSPYGVQDLSGNVWEWVEDCYHASYSGADRPDDGTAWVTTCSGSRVIRGGGIEYSASAQRASERYPEPVWAHLDDFGIRCCKSPGN